MDKPERIGTTISAAGHMGIVAWILFGGVLFRAPPEDPVQMSEVSLMSEADFQALAAGARPAPQTATEAPPAPQSPEAEATPDAPAPESAPDPVQPDEPPVAEPDTQPIADTQPVIPEAPVAPPVPDIEVPSDTVLAVVSPRPRPRPAPNVADTATEAPPPDAVEAPVAATETVPDEVPTPPVEPEPIVETTAPPDTTDRIITEADQPTDVAQSSAPLTSGRPKPKPEKPAPAPAPTEMAAVQPAGDPIADALREAMAGAGEAAAGNGTEASGPPMTGGEKEGLMLAIKACWDVGTLSTEALRTQVTVRVLMGPDGKPDKSSIEMLSFEGGSEESAKRAFEVGRRAVLLCAGPTGYTLPAEKYEHWRELNLVFNPAKMESR